MGAPSYTDAAELRARTGVPTTGAFAATDAQLEAALSASEALAKRYLGYDPVSQSRTDYYSPAGGEVLALGHPVTAVASVYANAVGYGVSANFTADHLLVEGTDYLLEGVGTGTPGLLRRIGTVWPYSFRRELGLGGSRLSSDVAPAPKSVRVTYTVGLAGSDLDAVRDAVYGEAAARLRARLGVGVLTGESLDGYSYSVQPGGKQDDAGPFVSPYAYQTLRGYRRVPVGGY